MATMTGYPAGAPCWCDLATTDLAVATTFYAELLGWTANAVPVPGGGTYSIFQLGGRDVAAVYGLMDTQKAEGVPSHWDVYFAVANVDEACERATTLGASVLVTPMDVMTFGRMAAIADPEGAAFCLWQPMAHFGAAAVHENNAIGWVELASRDTRKASSFYAALLGWKTRELPHPVAGHYQMFAVEGYDWGGLLPMDDRWGNAPAHWQVYLRVADCDAAAARVKALGGRVMAEPFQAPGVGRIAVVADPQGATFYLVTFRAG